MTTQAYDVKEICREAIFWFNHPCMLCRVSILVFRLGSDTASSVAGYSDRDAVDALRQHAAFRIFIRSFSCRFCGFLP